MFNILSKKLLFIVAGLGLTTAGLIGPTVFLDGMGGKLTLFELTHAMDSLNSFGFAKISSTGMYFWIGVVFIALIVMSVVATLMRLYVGVWLFAVLGVSVWGVSYYYFREWHGMASKVVSKFGDTASTSVIMIKNLNLQWGAWCILAGMVLLFLASMMRSR